MFIVLWQMKNNYHIEHNEFKKIVGSSSSSTAACVATAGTTLIIGSVSFSSTH